MCLTYKLEPYNNTGFSYLQKFFVHTNYSSKFQGKSKNLIIKKNRLLRTFLTLQKNNDKKIIEIYNTFNKTNNFDLHNLRKMLKIN